MLLRRSTGSPSDVRDCARLLLDAGGDPNSHKVEWGGEGQMTALFDAVERSDLELALVGADAPVFDPDVTSASGADCR